MTGSPNGRTTKLPPIGKKHGVSGSANDARTTSKVLSPQPKASSEVLNIIRLYKETAVPGAEGLTKADFRNLFFKRDPGDRRRRDKRFEEELCGDMFRLLDKDRDGYVTLQDLLEQFVPKQQLKRTPPEIFDVVNRRKKKVVIQSLETPRLSQKGAEEIREVWDLWTNLARDAGDPEGKLSRDAVIHILAARKNPELNWTEAREAVDRIFAELPSTVDALSFGDMLNHMQEVLSVPYSELSDGLVRKLKKHPCGQVDVEVEVQHLPREKLPSKKNVAASDEHPHHSSHRALPHRKGESKKPLSQASETSAPSKAAVGNSSNGTGIGSGNRKGSAVNGEVQGNGGSTESKDGFVDEK